MFRNSSVLAVSVMNCIQLVSFWLFLPKPTFLAEPETTAGSRNQRILCQRRRTYRFLKPRWGTLVSLKVALCWLKNMGNFQFVWPEFRVCSEVISQRTMVVLGVACGLAAAMQTSGVHPTMERMKRIWRPEGVVLMGWYDCLHDTWHVPEKRTH